MDRAAIITFFKTVQELPCGIQRLPEPVKWKGYKVTHDATCPTSGTRLHVVEQDEPIVGIRSNAYFMDHKTFEEEVEDVCT